MIVLENVVKEYPNGVGAINGISLHIERGEFVFVVGDSGSGKSTLIKLLLKELEPTSGTIRVNGVNLGRMKKRAIPKYRRKIGCVFQDFRLLKDRNVYENVAFAQRVVVTPIKEIKKNVPDLRKLQETHRRLYGALYPHRPLDRWRTLQSAESYQLCGKA